MKQLTDILNSPCGHRNLHLAEKPAKVKGKVIKPRNDCKEVQWIHWQLKYWCIEQKLTLLKEHYFAKPRMFRFDFAIEEHKIAVEYDGLNSEKSGHTTLMGFTSDTEKINLAISKGWRVLRYTVINYENVLQDVQKLINQK